MPVCQNRGGRVAEETQEQAREPMRPPALDVAAGAAAAAPTAPHATPPTDEAGARTGPARFWGKTLVRQGLVLGFGVSAAFHYWIAPFSVMPEGPPIEFHDQAGELSIPIDVIEGTTETPQNQQNATTHTPGSGDPGATGLTDAAARDASGDAGALAAFADAEADGAIDASGDAESTTAADDAGLVAFADGGGRDPQSILGLAGSVSAGPNNVTIMVNFAELRRHPESARVDAVLGGIPQWRDFMSNSSGAALLDPMRDADWMLIMGPSLVDTQKDAVFLHYSVDDAVVDGVIDEVSKKYAKGGRINVGVPHVKAWRAFADRGERVFLRPRSHLAVIVPASNATQFARVLAQAPVTPHVHAGEAVSLRAVRPGGSISAIPSSISELTLWLVPRASDSGADLYIDGETPDEASATAAAEQVRNLIQQKNSFGVRLMTAGIFNKVDITTSGNQVHGHISGSREQVEAILGLVAGVLHVTLPPAASAPPAAAPSAPPEP